MSRTYQLDAEISDLVRKLSTVTECDQAAVRLASLGTAAVSELKKFLSRLAGSRRIVSPWRVD